MEILYLDDDVNAVNAFFTFMNTFEKKYEITAVSNLVDFDEELYESGKSYDKYILDLGIVAPNEFSKEMYDNWLEDIGITEVTHLGAVISVPGWDYYEKVMRTRDLTKNRLDHVMLKTGYAELLKKEVSEQRYLPATLLNKGDEHYEEILKKFLIK